MAFLRAISFLLSSLGGITHLIYLHDHNTKTRNSRFRFLFLSSSSCRRIQSLRERGEWVNDIWTGLRSYFNRFTDIHIFWVLVTTCSVWGLLHFGSDATFPIADIHVCIPSHRYPSRHYVLLLDTWGSSFTINQYSSLSHYWHVMWFGAFWWL